MKLIHLSVLAFVMSCGLSCKKNDKSSPSNQPDDQGPQTDGQDNTDQIGPGQIALGTVNFGVAAVNGLDATNSQVTSEASTVQVGNLAVTTAGLRSFNLAEAPLQEIPNPVKGRKGELNGITSGQPDGFRVKITRISFKSENSEAKVFESEEGAEISIEGAKVDLAAVIAALGDGAESTEFATLKVPAGTYSEIEVHYKKRAEIKGCVEGLFDSANNKLYQAVPPGSTGISIDDPIAEYTGTHIFCTKAAKSLYNVKDTSKPENFFHNEDFKETDKSEGKAEWMAIELGKYPTWSFQPSKDGLQPSPHSTDDKETWNYSYKLLKPVEVKESESLDMTMVIDMNRLLRYETGATMNNWGPEKNRPSDKYPVERNPSFFFDSTFGGSAFVFAGKPGGIFGYEVLNLVCPDEFHDAAAFRCDDPNSNTVGDDYYWVVETWMTLVTDSTGAPLSMLIQPKDDTRLTTLVGSHPRTGQWVFPSADGKTADIRYGMNDDFIGTIFGFPADLTAYEPVAEGAGPDQGHFTLKWDLHTLSDKYNGKAVYPQNVIDAGKGPYNGNLQGAAVFWRRL